MLTVRRDEYGFACDITGGTLDLCAGQAIDRTGVMLGFAFPCGVHIEKAALEYTDNIKLPRLSVKDTYFNLSGLENMVKKEFDKSGDKAKCSRLCLEFIAANLRAAILSQIEKYGERPVICSGGVMSNSIIKVPCLKMFAKNFMKSCSTSYKTDFLKCLFLYKHCLFLCKTAS